MYAIIRAGGKQYRVQAGETIRVEKLANKLGETFDLTDLLMVGGDKTFSGTQLKNAKVSVTVIRQAKSPKIIVFKKKRRQGYRRMHGHRQLFTELFVNSITSPEGQTAKTDKEAVIVDPARIQAHKDEFAAKQASGEKKAAAPKAQRPRGAGAHDTPKPIAKRAAAKKTVGKKTTKAKKSSGGAKKKTAKKKTSKK